MLSSLFGFLSALSWGAGDFSGGLASRRTGAYRSAFYAEWIGVLLLLVMLAIVRERMPSWTELGWSAAAGLFGAIGLALLYRSLSEGQMSVAAPVSALMAAVLPVIAGALTEGLPGPLKYAGFVLALAAIWLISRGEGHRKEVHLHLLDLSLPLISGVCFGVYFILIHLGSRGATVWPMLAARLTGSLMVFVFAAAGRQLNRPDLRTGGLIFLNALGDIGGNTFYILAGQVGRLDVAAVLGSLYPGTTVLLAGLILKERLNRSQWVGILAALTAIALMTL